MSLLSIVPAVSDDLVEAIEYAFGKDIRLCEDADVIVTVERSSAEDKKFRRCRIAINASDTYYEYEMNEPKASSCMKFA